MSQQLSIFDKPKAASCQSVPEQKIKYAIKESDLSGLTIKEQMLKLAAVSCGPGYAGSSMFEKLIEGKGFDYLDARDNWIDCPQYMSENICKLFDLSEFPVNQAPMPRPVLPPPWFESMMDKPEADERILNAPRDKWITLGTGNPYVKPQEKYVLGPYPTQMIQWLPLKDRVEVRDFMRLHPNLDHFVNVAADDKPRRVMPEETKVKIRMLNAMRRAVKKYGVFAEEFARDEVAARGWEWSDETWQRANEPPKQSKKPYGKKKRKGRSTDNDEWDR